VALLDQGIVAGLGNIYAAEATPPQPGPRCRLIGARQVTIVTANREPPPRIARIASPAAI
jgi:formamidopyrimidine-DNA glycosylase